jgi:hypothetical protein
MRQNKEVIREQSLYECKERSWEVERINRDSMSVVEREQISWAR